MSPSNSGRWLVLDTAAPEAVVGVVDVDAGLVVCEVWLRETRLHSERLPSAVAEALNGQQVQGVGAGIGPGSFIGVRTGIAFAKGLCRAWQVPLIGVPSLWALASSVDGVPAGLCVAVLDARRGERYAQLFNAQGHGDALSLQASGEAVAVAPTQLPASDVVIGVDGTDGFVRSGPSAQGMLRVLQRLLPRSDERASVVPLYVRAPDAKLPSLDPARHRPAEVP